MHGCLEIWNSSSRVQLNTSHSFVALTRLQACTMYNSIYYYFFHLNEEIDEDIQLFVIMKIMEFLFLGLAWNLGFLRRVHVGYQNGY